jgi:uncharacterized protein (DUF2141 family)
MLLISLLHFLLFQNQTGLKLTIENALPNVSVRVGVFTNAKGFPDAERVKFYKEFRSGSSNVSDAVFGDIPPGTYALAVYQDINNNKKLDVNMFGYPTEPFGFSNNIRPKFKAPSFEACKFEYSANKNTIRIKLIR